MVSTDAAARHRGDERAPGAEPVAARAEPRRGLGPDPDPQVGAHGFAHMFDYSRAMEVGDLVRIGTRGVQQFRVLEVDDTTARIEPTLDAPGAYPFRLRLVDLTPWTE